MTEQIIQKLSANGTKARLIPVSALTKVREAYEKLDHSSPLWTRYLSALKTAIPAEMEAGRSILVAADPSSAVRVTFLCNGKERSFLIPPTYLYKHQRQRTKELVENVFAECGHSAWKAYLPCKMLGVLSGLSKYGRNNVTYIDSLGSYVYIQVFVTTLEPDSGVCEVEVARECVSCSRCINACPTGAISGDRFLIDAGRCVTFCNEMEQPFPEWMPKHAHNCVVGCMSCQLACPMNEGKLKTEEGPVFDEDETRMILSGVSFGELPEKTINKIKHIEFDGDHKNFVRNVQALINKN